MKSLGHLLLLVLLVSCASKKDRRAQYPQWYLEPNTSDEQFFYASGKGAAKDPAIKDALREIAAQIKTVVSSKFKQDSVTSSHARSNVIRSTLELETSKVDLTGYKVLKTHQTEDFDFLVLVQVEKASVLQTYGGQRDRLAASIEQKLQATSVGYLRSSPKLHAELEEYEAVLAILGSLGAPVGADQSKLQGYREQARTKLDGVSFSILLEDPKFQQTANVLKTAVTEQGYRISELEAPLIFRVGGEMLDQKQGNLFLVKQKVSIRLQDPAGETFSTNTVEEIGSSTLSFEDAALNTGVSLKEKLKKVGFRKYVGID